MSDHNDIVEKLVQQFTKRGFKPQTKENNLPTGAGRNEAIYRPDIIVRNSDGEIVWLVEVETSEGGKAVAGAAILADITMQKMSVRNKPKLMFVFYRTDSNLKLAEKRLLALKERISGVELMPPLSEKDALEQIGKGENK